MKRRLAAVILGVSIGLAYAVPADAHISLEKGGTHLSRYGEGSLKEGPCGKAGGKRGTNVYTYAPGQSITVSLVETIPHPSYYRIAFDNDGDDGFVEPASIKPIDPKRKCPNGPGDYCGAADFYNAPTVLAGMDNLNPHLAPAVAPKYTWTVKLPDVECNNCTLQIIQVMEDDLFHGPYDPTPGVGVEDIYHQCIDLVLERGAVPSGPDASSGSSGSTEGSSGTSGAPELASGDGGVQNHDPTSGSSDSSGGCSVTGRQAGLSTLVGSLALLGLLWSRRRHTRPTKAATGNRSVL